MTHCEPRDDPRDKTALCGLGVLGATLTPSLSQLRERVREGISGKRREGHQVGAIETMRTESDVLPLLIQGKTVPLWK